MLRRLRQRLGPEPPSIFEHIRAHARSDAPGLTEGSEDLPDEEIFNEGGIRFAPGALEGAFVRYAESHDDDAALERLHSALVALANRPGARTRERVREFFREGDVRMRVDALTSRLSAFPPKNPETLYAELREIFLKSGHRDEVKYAMALMSTFRRPEDADLFRVIGRHEEFTLYAAVAVSNVVEDPVSEWLDLLPHVSGWGRTELSELILREPQPESIREKLVRDGLGIGNALTLAQGCRLHELLAPPEVDDDLLIHGRDIIDSLVWSWDSPSVLTDYEHAGEASEHLVRHLSSRAPDLDDFVSVFELRRLLTDKSFRYDSETGEDTIANAGFDEARFSRVVALCTAFIERDLWLERAQRAMASENADERRQGMEVAGRLGVDLHEYLIEQIRNDPGDPGLWYRFVAGADEPRLREAVDLAVSLWDLSEISRGPALEHFGGPSGPLASVDYILQELPRFQGVGASLIGASLQSPVIRHRLIALRALSRWHEKPASLMQLVGDLAGTDPHEDVRQSASEVIAGKLIEDPNAESDFEVDGDEGSREIDAEEQSEPADPAH
jgi:hypothetical protein